MPLLENMYDPGRVAEPHCLQRLNRSRIIVDACEDKIARFARQPLFGGEEVRVRAMHAPPNGGDVRLEPGFVPIA